MCGIFGYYDRGGDSLEACVLAEMGEAIRHRGPDDRGIYAVKGMAIGNQRLSVIDLKGGRQPFISDDGQIIVVQNGEIFNHVELAQELKKFGNPCRTHSDTEVLLRLYEREGIDFIHKLNGMFAFAIIDKREQAMYIVRDRIGVKPMYIHDDGLKLVFASEIKSILKSGISKPCIDKEALHHYLSFNYVPAPYTIYNGIKHLMPGHAIKVTREGSKIWRWWDLAAVQPEYGRAEKSWIEEFNSIIDDAVRIRLRSDVPFGAFLSGGVDSSTVVGLMSRQMNEPVKTFCIGFHDSRYDESIFADVAASRFNTRHIMQRVDPDMLELWPMVGFHCDQPHGDVSFLPTYRVSEIAVRDVKVVLTGDGADELFAGYDKYKNFFTQQNIATLEDNAFQRRYFASISLFNEDGKRSLYSTEMRNDVDRLDSFDVAKPWFDSVPHQDRINQALFLDMQLLLSGNNLVKPDRMGMAVSLEARTPFLDYRMMEFAFRMPGELKLKDNETKYLYKKAVSGLIGNDLAYRKKQMFTMPVGDWFRESKREYCQSHFEQLKKHDSLFDSQKVQTLLDDHLNGKNNNTRELRALISLNHWLQRNCSEMN
jgi:asparagine synthase (glutamine-hydrolysing)